MSTAIHIRCERCSSYRVKRRPDPPKRESWILRVLNWSPKPFIPPNPDEPRPGIYECTACGHTFEVRDLEAYARAHPITLDRCISCDQIALELVERDINPTGRPASLERADVYRCKACGAEYQMQTRDDPNTVYL